MVQHHPDPFVRAARWVGDFANPFYAEERQRDVLNEASAFGLQLALVLTVAASTATIWLVGAPARPYVQGAIALVGVVSLLTLAYAARLGVDAVQPSRLSRARMVPFLLLCAALVAGLARAGDDASWSTAAGAVTGALVAAALLALAARLLRPAHDDAPD